MKIHRFIGNFDFSAPILKISDTDLIHQLIDVLRFKINSQFILVSSNQEARVRLQKILPNQLLVEVEDMTAAVSESAISVTLYCALLKRDNFELVAQKATEVGISTLVPLLTEHTVKQGLRPERLQAIMKEAAEQSGRVTIPVLKPITTFTQAMADAQSLDQIWFCASSGKDSKADASKAAASIGVFIGPEGGWSKPELELVASLPIEPVSLGSLTLRAETAAIVASYLATR